MCILYAISKTEWVFIGVWKENRVTTQAGVSYTAFCEKKSPIWLYYIYLCIYTHYKGHFRNSKSQREVHARIVPA